jgi:peptidoglycan/LPS O-acetylase OafA/YrhL
MIYQRLIDPPRSTPSQVSDRPKPSSRHSPFPRDLEVARKAQRETSESAAATIPEVFAKAQHVPVLDAWRGTALVLLMIGHFFPIRRWDCGAMGVEFFFILSGFLIGGILFVRETPLKTFYQRRISRVFPAAYVFLLAMLGWQLLATTDVVPSLSTISACFLFYINYVVASDPGVQLGLPAAHFWSLCVEEHCYLYLSLLAVFHRKLRIHPLWLIGGSILLCFAWAGMIGRETNWNPYQVYWRSDCRAASILMGAAAACLVSLEVGSRKSYLGVPTIGWGILAVCWATYFRLHSMPEFTKYTSGSALLAVGLLLISQHAKGKLWAFPPLVWFGTASFSLYLWQQPFYIAVHKGQMTTGYAVVAAILAGLVSYFLIEKPARSWINRRWN